MAKKFIVRQRRPAYGKSVVISTRLPENLVRQLDHVAQKTGRTRNELVVMCVEYAMEDLEIEEKAEVP